MEISPLLLSLIIFMFLTSFTLAGFVIRQKKSNRMLGEIAAQSRIENVHRYSVLGIGLRNQEYVSRCPACAEWMYLLANICATCQHNVESYNLNLERAMQEIDADIVATNFAREASGKAKWDAFIKNRLFRASVGISAVVIISLVGFQAQSTYRYNKTTAMPDSASALVISWNSIMRECLGVRGTGNWANENEYGRVSVQMRLPYINGVFPDWNTPTGQEIVCFSKKALAFDVSKDFGTQQIRDNRVSLRNSFEISIEYGYYGGSNVATVQFSWSD